MAKDRPEEVTTEHLVYLDTLRESGDTNMFGAGKYLGLLSSDFPLGQPSQRVLQSHVLFV